MKAVRWSEAGLRSRVQLAILGVAIVGLVGVVFVTVTFVRIVEARERLADRLDPAGFAARVWIGTLVDQESGVRGYALTGDEQFLEPYRTSRAGAVVAERDVRRFLADEPEVLVLVDRFDRQASAWSSAAAAPIVAATRVGGAGSVSDAELVRSKASFDRVRARYQTLQDELDASRDDARSALGRHTRDLLATTVVVVLLAALALLAIWIALQRWVLDPLASLAHDAKQVAGGDLAHPVVGAGPPDLQHLADDMEAMRRRIVAELEVAETARQRLEEQALDLSRSNQELEQFAYVASHDLQEPLRKITGFCQLLQRRYGGQLDDRADEYIAFAVDGAKRMQTLINDLLAFSRVGRTTETFTEVRLDDVASLARDTLAEAIADARGQVEIEPLPTVRGDAGLLELLLQNLIGNALKFRAQDPPVVVISARPSDELDGWELACTDNGIGIDPAYADRVFVIFQRLYGRDAYEGTGIGLAMCRKIVEFHGGRIWVDPAPDRAGTVVRWTLPTAGPAPRVGDLAPLPPSQLQEQP